MVWTLLYWVSLTLIVLRFPMLALCCRLATSVGQLHNRCIILTKIQLQLSENVLLWNNRLWCGRRKPDPRGAFHSKYFICRCQRKAKASSDISGRLCKVQFLRMIQQSKWKLVGETNWLTLNLEWSLFFFTTCKGSLFCYRMSMFGLLSPSRSYFTGSFL